MKKFLILLCALVLFGTALAAAESEPRLEGRWEDTVSMRAFMDIHRHSEGIYDIRVYWGAGVFESAVWEMTGVYDPQDGLLKYSDGSSYTQFYDEDGNLTDKVVEYENASGTIGLDENGCLRIVSDDEGLGECRFAWSQALQSAD